MPKFVIAKACVRAFAAYCLAVQSGVLLNGGLSEQCVVFAIGMAPQSQTYGRLQHEGSTSEQCLDLLGIERCG